MIGKCIEIVKEMDDFNSIGLSCRPFLYLRVQIDTSLPLAPGYYLPRDHKPPLRISYCYEHLGDYCTLYGLIGHKKTNCPASPQLLSDKYKFPLQTFSLYGLRQTPSPPREDSNSGLSSVRTAQSHFEAQSSFVHGDELTPQLVPHHPQTQLALHVAVPPSFHVVQAPFNYYVTQVQESSHAPNASSTQYPCTTPSASAHFPLLVDHMASPLAFQVQRRFSITQVGANPYDPSTPSSISPDNTL